MCCRKLAVVRYLLRAIGQGRANPFQYSVGQTETQSESLQKKVVVDTVKSVMKLSQVCEHVLCASRL